MKLLNSIESMAINIDKIIIRRKLILSKLL